MISSSCSGGREQEKKPAAVWVPDSDASICMCCLKTKFNALVRKHHCRKCGNVVCGTCSTKRFILPDIATKALRVCDTCYKDLILPVSQDQGAVGLPPSTFASQLNNTGTRPKQSDQMANYGSSDEDDDDEIPAVQVTVYTLPTKSSLRYYLMCYFYHFCDVDQILK